MWECRTKLLYGSQAGRTRCHVLVRMIKDNVNLYDGRADAFLGCRKWHHVYTGERRGERQGQAVAGQRETIDQPDAESLVWVGGKSDVVRFGLAAERYDVSHAIHFCVLRSMRPEVGVVLSYRGKSPGGS